MRFVLIAIAALALQACQNVGRNDNGTSQNPSKLSRAADYNMQLGLGYLKQGDRPRAKRKLLTAMHQNPHSASIYAAMAYYFEETGDINNARSHYLKAIDLAENKGPQFNNYGAFLCRQGQYRDAENYFMRAVEDTQYIHTAGAYENAGLCVLSIPDTAKAESYFKKALEQDPTRKMSLYELVKLKSKAGENTQALTTLLKYPDFLSDPTILELSKQIVASVDQPDLVARYNQQLDNIKQFSQKTGAQNDNNNDSNG